MIRKRRRPCATSAGARPRLPLAAPSGLRKLHGRGLGPQPRRARRHRLEAALRAKRLVDRDTFARCAMEMLLEITQAATSSLELEQVLAHRGGRRSARVIPRDRCSVVLVEGDQPRVASVVASRDVPGLLAACSWTSPATPSCAAPSRPPAGARRGRGARPADGRRCAGTSCPLGRAGVLVQPLICQDDLLGRALPAALPGRTARSAGTSRSSPRRWRPRSPTRSATRGSTPRCKKKREDLESAYVDRYRELTRGQPPAQGAQPAQGRASSPSAATTCARRCKCCWATAGCCSRASSTPQQRPRPRRWSGRGRRSSAWSEPARAGQGRGGAAVARPAADRRRRAVPGERRRAGDPRRRARRAAARRGAREPDGDRRRGEAARRCCRT